MDTRTKREADLSSAHEKLDKINIQRGRLAKREQNLGAEGEEFEPLKEFLPEEKKVPLRFRFKRSPRKRMHQFRNQPTGPGARLMLIC